jgi:hypothetical protein
VRCEILRISGTESFIACNALWKFMSSEIAVYGFL